MSWPRLAADDRFNVYREDLAEVGSSYGTCASDLDPDPTDTFFVDVAVPPAGGGWFYLMARVRDGVESGLGFATDGQPRVPTTICP